MKKPTLYFIIPCYNEEDVLPVTAPIFKKKLFELSDMISEKSHIVFVNDGSEDNTWNIIIKLHEESPVFSGICLNSNRGHQNALMDGLMWAKDKCDITISIDADLQDDIDVVDKMITKYLEGNGIVCGVRKSRDKDSFLKRNTARGYYKLMKMFGSDIIYDHADYRLMDAVALNKLSRYHGDSLFLRGFVNKLGARVDVVYYDRLPREVGKSKYTIKKMFQLALKGITSARLKECDVERDIDPAIGKVLHKTII